MFVLPDLPYKYNALEPYFDEQTMIIHHTKHHQAYVDKLNSALSEYPDLQDKGIEELLKAIDTLPEPLREVVKNHGGGHYNHSHFWNSLKAGGSTPDKQVEMLINKSYGNFENFKQVFTDAALSLFGSGWVWLELDSDKKVSVKKYILQENPLMEGK
ncbi:MAG: superoxide dismutase, partial [Patescibacteria group bacterium]|nr:superoxide dismutase [Patescibacteria group bacterium]